MVTVFWRVALLLSLCVAGCTAPATALDPAPVASGGVPGPLIETINYAIVPDQRFIWHGPAAAAGIVVWSHGKGGFGVDLRGVEPPPFVHRLNNVGYDVVRFDRAPFADETERAAGWLRSSLASLRQDGYRRIIAGGQSRGAWNSLEMLHTAGLADVIIALAPAREGTASGINLRGQSDDFRAMLSDLPHGDARVAMAQFDRDLFMGSADERRALMERLVAPSVSALLLIDRPPGLRGHSAGTGKEFDAAFGECLVQFATAPTPPDHC
jgi:hypothetical protein